MAETFTYEDSLAWAIDGAIVADIEYRVSYKVIPGHAGWLNRANGGCEPPTPATAEIAEIKLLCLKGWGRTAEWVERPCPDWLADMIEQRHASENYADLLGWANEMADDERPGTVWQSRCDAADADRAAGDV